MFEGKSKNKHTTIFKKGNTVQGNLELLLAGRRMFMGEVYNSAIHREL